jgi:hypothetical protein
MDTPEVFDLADARVQRAKTRAAAREGKGDLLDLRFGGESIAVLGAELPLDVLAPLKEINLDIALLVRQAMEAANAETAQAHVIALGLDILAANPSLPAEMIDAVQEMGRRLFGEEGYQAFVGCRPSREDVTALFRYLMNWYGVSLGEFSGSSTESTDGETSNPTSSTTTEPTPAASGGPHQIPGSSASDGSPTSSSGSPTMP